MPRRKLTIEEKRAETIARYKAANAHYLYTDKDWNSVDRCIRQLRKLGMTATEIRALDADSRDEVFYIGGLDNGV